MGEFYLGIMKQIYFSVMQLLAVAGFLLLFLLGIQSVAFGQCNNNNSFLTDMTPSSPGVTVTNACVRGGRYVTVSVCAGAQYTFKTCASNAFDTQLTLYNNTGGAALAFNDDFCGLQSQIIWTATFTGVVRVLLDRYNCNNSNLCQTLEVTWDTGCPASGSPGDDCANAIPVTCGQTRTGETTLGNGDTGNNWSCYTTPIATPGADRFYALTVTDPAATVVRVTLTNVTDDDTYVEVLSLGNSCATNTCLQISQFVTASGTFSATGLTSYDFAISGAGTWFFVIDGQADGVSNYDIQFECISTGVKLDTSGCVGPPADLNHDGYAITWNGGAAGPVSHGDVGTICYTIYTNNPNPAGWEWLKYVNITLGNCWKNVSNITPDAPPLNNGFYDLNGTWQGNYNAGLHEVQYDFTNSRNPAWGDGTTPGFSCLPYVFCFQAEVDTTGCPGEGDAGLNNIIYIEDDGVGGTGNTQASNALVLSPDFFLQGILAINLKNYEVYPVDAGIQVKWSSYSEVNSDHYSLSRSVDGINFTQVATQASSGNSTVVTRYAWVDRNPMVGENMYRLTEIDREGRTTVLGTKSAWYQPSRKMVVGNLVPNPARNVVAMGLQCSEEGLANIEVFNAMGGKVYADSQMLNIGQNDWKIDLEKLLPGVYFLKVSWKNEVEILRLVKE